MTFTKACAGGADLAHLYEEINWLGAGVTMGQHPMRIWEYALAVRALQTWTVAHGNSADPLTGQARVQRILDVGGSGSYFGPTLQEKLGPAWAVELVDPKETVALGDREGDPADVILCISTIEHVPHQGDFLTALAKHLRVGGLAFLTMDGKGDEGSDVQHFHWMRERIYTPGLWTMLAAEAGTLGLHLWGGVDWRYQGAQVYDYSFLSLCLRKV